MYDLKQKQSKAPASIVHVSVAEPAMYDLKLDTQNLRHPFLRFSCWTSNVWFETRGVVYALHYLCRVSVAEPAMYDLKRGWLTDVAKTFVVSVAEPAMYDLKHFMINCLTQWMTFQLLNQQCMIWNFRWISLRLVWQSVSVAEPAMYDLKPWSKPICTGREFQLLNQQCMIWNLRHYKALHEPFSVSVAEPAM